jgi:hypothetical protein
MASKKMIITIEIEGSNELPHRDEFEIPENSPGDLTKIFNWIKHTLNNFFYLSQYKSKTLPGQVSISDPEMEEKVRISPPGSQTEDLPITLGNDANPADDVVILDTDDMNDQVNILPDPVQQPTRQAETCSDLKVIVRRDAFLMAKEHAGVDKSRESGGVLLGRFCHDKNNHLAVVITGIVRALRAVRQYASVNFNPEAWAEIWRSIDYDPIYSDESWKMVGWYHTHPRFGIFLSSMDRFIQEEYFKLPGHIALVIDPVNDTEGYFGWDQDHKSTCPCSPGNLKVLDDEALIAALNQEYGVALESLPSPEIKNIAFENQVHQTDEDTNAAPAEETPAQASPEEKPVAEELRQADDAAITTGSTEQPEPEAARQENLQTTEQISPEAASPESTGQPEKPAGISLSNPAFPHLLTDEKWGVEKKKSKVRQCGKYPEI